MLLTISAVALPIALFIILLAAIAFGAAVVWDLFFSPVKIHSVFDDVVFDTYPPDWNDHV